MIDRILSVFKEIGLMLRGVNVFIGRNHIWSLSVYKTRKSKINVGKGLVVRKNVIFNVSESGVLDVGKKVFINFGTKINVREHITISDGCLIGQDVLIYDHDHDYKSDNIREKFITKPVFIGKNVWIGSGVIILKGVTIGDNSVIAAGTVVNKDVPDNVLYYRDLGTEHIKPIETKQ